MTYFLSSAIKIASTTVTTTETTTQKSTVDPLSFMGKSIDELIEMYSEDCESYSLEGAHYVQFYDKDEQLFCAAPRNGAWHDADGKHTLREVRACLQSRQGQTPF